MATKSAPYLVTMGLVGVANIILGISVLLTVQEPVNLIAVVNLIIGCLLLGIFAADISSNAN